MGALTAGLVAIEESLPSEFRGRVGVLDKSGLKKLLAEVGQRYPERYKEISHKLNMLGADFSYRTGSTSFGVKHLLESDKGREHKAKLRAQIDAILSDENLPQDQKEKLVVLAANKARDAMQKDIFEELKAKKNPLATQVLSGTRGSAGNLMSLFGSDLLYVDHKDNVIPVPILHSFSEGLTPAEFFASSYGTRRGILATKMATQKAGYFSKLIGQASHRLVVTDDDDEEDEQVSQRGLPVPVDDPDNEGSLLAFPVGGYERNTVLTPEVLSDLKRQKLKNIVVRSPISGIARHGGVHAKDVGVREFGRLPRKGEAPGLVAAQALSEPVSQAQLGAKHSGGVAGAERGVGGFALIEANVQVPQVFPGGAAHSELDGQVDSIEPAPAGGHFIHINGQRHFAPEGMKVTVSKGDTVEAGDVLSEGFPNPAKIVEHKGIGEGRRYFVEAMRDAYSRAGIKANRRNLELISRGLINHVRINQMQDGYLPDDVITYDFYERNYIPRETSRQLPLLYANNKYLEEPILHYTLGTKLRPSVVRTLQEHGIENVTVNEEPPPFEPKMIRAMENLQHDPDWMVRMYGSGLKKSLLDAAHRSMSSDPYSTSFVPSLARGVDFGKSDVVRPPGFDPNRKRLPFANSTPTENQESAEERKLEKSIDAQPKRNPFSTQLPKRFKAADTGAAFQPEFHAPSSPKPGPFASVVSGFAKPKAPSAPSRTPEFMQPDQPPGGFLDSTTGTAATTAAFAGGFGTGSIPASVTGLPGFALSVGNAGMQRFMPGFHSAMTEGLRHGATRVLGPNTMARLTPYAARMSSFLNQPGAFPNAYAALRGAPTAANAFGLGTGATAGLALYGAYAAPMAMYDAWSMSNDPAARENWENQNTVSSLQNGSGAYGTTAGALARPGMAYATLLRSAFGRKARIGPDGRYLDDPLNHEKDIISLARMQSQRANELDQQLSSRQPAVQQQEQEARQEVLNRIAAGQGSADDRAWANYWKRQDAAGSASEQLSKREPSLLGSAYLDPLKAKATEGMRYAPAGMAANLGSTLGSKLTNYVTSSWRRKFQGSSPAIQTARTRGRRMT